MYDQNAGYELLEVPNGDFASRQPRRFASQPIVQPVLQQSPVVVQVNNSSACCVGWTWVMFVLGFCFVFPWCIGAFGICSPHVSDKVGGVVNAIITTLIIGSFVVYVVLLIVGVAAL